MSESAAESLLVVVFNQDFSCNIPKLERLYRHRFPHILYVVPDHSSALHRWYTQSRMPQGLVQGTDRAWNLGRRLCGRRNPHEIDESQRALHDRRIVRVVGHQFYFYDFIVQALGAIRKKGVEWVWVVGDDALLNPRIRSGNILDFVGGNKDDDAVVCRPVLGSDAWLDRIVGSPARGRRILDSILGDAYHEARVHHGIACERGADVNQSVMVGCADFIGLRVHLLESAARLWRECFKAKLYVEIAVPSVVLSLAQKPVLVQDYAWKQETDYRQWRCVADTLLASETTIFAHPVKLSALPTELLGNLC